MKSFSGAVAAITGAGSGIGQALAINLAKQGCHLALSDVNESALEHTRALLEPYPVTLTMHTVDVSERTAVFEWAQQVVESHGQVNLLFNNAGVALSGTVESLNIEDFEWIMNINFRGTLYGTKAFLPHLHASGAGHIVNVSSVFGLAAQPLMSGYNASKFAVRGFTEALRQDLELTNSNVSTTCVHPGGIRTNIAKSARMDESVQQVIGVDDSRTVAEFERTFMTSPDKAARIIVKAVKANRRRILVGPDALIWDWFVRLAPSFYQRVFVAFMRWRSRKLSLSSAGSKY